MFVRADKPNRCSEQMFASDRWIVAANRTNVRLRQDPISGPEICKPNKCSPADTAADIVPHARPEDKSRDRNRKTRRTCSRSGTRCTPTPCDRMQNTRKGSGTAKRGNAAQANILPLELILKHSATIYTLKHLTRLNRQIIDRKPINTRRTGTGNAGNAAQGYISTV